MPDEEVIDLTLSDDEPEQNNNRRDRKRPRLVDNDVIIIEDSSKDNDREADVELNEDGIAIVSADVEDWTTLPHTRDLCRQFAFSASVKTSNSQHCARCFCYVCDCPAQECTQWGSGSSSSHHCNAHSGSVAYRVMRTQKQTNRPATTTAPAPAPVPAPAPAPAARPSNAFRGIGRAMARIAAQVSRPISSPELSEPSESEGCGDSCQCWVCISRRIEAGSSDSYDSYENDGPGFGMIINLAKPPEKPKKCTFKEAADPSEDDTMFELARLSFPCEAIGNNTIADIAQRLVPHGFYLSNQSGHTRSYGEPSKLTLQRLIEDEYTAYDTHRAVMKLLPLQSAPPPAEPFPDRIRSVLVQFWDGRSRITRYGFRVPTDATLQTVHDELRKQLRLPSDVMALPFQWDLEGYGDGLNSPVRTMTTVKLSDSMVAERARYKREFLFYCMPQSKTPQKGYIGTTNARIKVCSSSATPSSGYIWDLLIPMEPTHMLGGSAAKRAVASALVAALRPYRLNPDDAQETATLEKSVIISFTPSFYAGRGTSLSNALPATHVNDHFRNIMGSDFKGLKLRAEWPQAQLEASFDLNEAKHPTIAVDPSASPEILAPYLDYAKAMKDYEVQVEADKNLPKRIVKEIESGSKQMHPDERGGNSALALSIRMHSSTEAICQYKAELIPDSTDKKKGTLNVRVFVWRTAGFGRKAFFGQGLQWAAGATGRRRHLMKTVEPHRLSLTMAQAFAESPEFAALQEKYKEAKAKDENLMSNRSITGLMEAMEKPEAPAAEQPEGLTVTLRPYQKQSLKFMLDAEQGQGGFRRHFWARVNAYDGTSFFYSPVLGRVARSVPSQPHGGFCCEEMGLGKTIEVLALCLANPAPQISRGSKTADGKFRSRATLVVCAVSLVGQWIAEAEQKTAGSLKIHMYHGTNRIRDPKVLANDFDLVVTTYATLSSDCGSKKSAGGFDPKKTPLHGVKWHRLVLDESHTCKNPAVGHTKACVALEADKRWLCTGTPINTDVQDLFGQFSVLRMEPFNHKGFFDSNVRSAFGSNHFYGGCPELLHALGSIMVRHTKRQELGGEQVLQLPPKTEELVPVILTADEQAAYNRVHATAVEYFQRYEAMGAHYVSKNLLHIMSLLLPMRRICSGGALTANELTVTEPEVTAAVASIAAQGGGHVSMAAANEAADMPVDETLVAPEGEECSICMDMYEQPTKTTCNHWFCKGCILGALQVNARCPLCRSSQRANQLKCGLTAEDAAERQAELAANAAERAAASAAAEAAAAARLADREAAIAGSAGGVISESKLRALLKRLRAMRREDPTAKALIFSQYNSTIEWLKGRLTREGFGHRHISGSMPLKQRAKAIQAFQGDPPTTVFLLSMRSGAVGINLTAASHVFLLEPALNPALEEQAIGRAWRMGQRREVKVLRFYVQGSVEERIMEVAKSKHSHAVGGAGGNNGGGAGPSNVNPWDEEEGYGRRQARSHVRVEDHAGSIKEDKQNLRLNELQLLFKEPEFPAPREESEDEEEDDWEPVGHMNGVQYADIGAGTSAMHAVMGSGGGHVPAAAAKVRMRRSKAGIAAIAGTAPATATPSRPGDSGAAETGSGATGSASAEAAAAAAAVASGATPAASLPGAPATVAPTRRPQQQQTREIVMEEEEEVEEPPAAILERIKSLAHKATGRLTPAEEGGIKAPSTGLMDVDNPGSSSGGIIRVGQKRNRVLSRAGQEAAASAAALAAHLPRPTPATDVPLVAGRSTRKVVRRNYAQMLAEGLDDGEEDDDDDNMLM